MKETIVEVLNTGDILIRDNIENSVCYCIKKPHENRSKRIQVNLFPTNNKEEIEVLDRFMVEFVNDYLDHPKVSHLSSVLQQQYQ